MTKSESCSKTRLDPVVPGYLAILRNYVVAEPKGLSSSPVASFEVRRPICC